MKNFLHRPQSLRATGIRQERSLFSKGLKSLLLAGSLVFAACASAPVEMQPAARRAELFPLMNAPLLSDASEVALGGFSGLVFEGADADGSLVFWSPTDRGPNAASYTEDGKPQNEFRPFMIPDFAPRWIRFKLNKSTREIEILSQVELSAPNGRALTGLPNFEASPERPGDEIPVNSKAEVLAMDPMGLDTEGLCFDSKSFGWMVEEYRPSIVKFDKSGKMIRRYVPVGSFSVREIKRIDKDYGEDAVMQVLPKELRQRKRNRGFEGVACLNDRVYAAMQSPLPGEGNKVRVIEFDPKEEEVTRELEYTLDDSVKADKIGDLTSDGTHLYAIEQNDKTDMKNGIHNVYKLTVPARDSKDVKLQKTHFMDLMKMGFAFPKVEGLAFVSPKVLAVVSDNDFSLAGNLDLKTGKVPMDKSARSTVGLIPTEEPPSP